MGSLLIYGVRGLLWMNFGPSILSCRYFEIASILTNIDLRILFTNRLRIHNLNCDFISH